MAEYYDNTLKRSGHKADLSSYVNKIMESTSDTDLSEINSSDYSDYMSSTEISDSAMSLNESNKLEELSESSISVSSISSDDYYSLSYDSGEESVSSTPEKKEIPIEYGTSWDFPRVIFANDVKENKDLPIINIKLSELSPVSVSPVSVLPVSVLPVSVSPVSVSPVSVSHIITPTPSHITTQSRSRLPIVWDVTQIPKHDKFKTFQKIGVK